MAPTILGQNPEEQGRILQPPPAARDLYLCHSPATLVPPGDGLPAARCDGRWSRQYYSPSAATRNSHSGAETSVLPQVLQ